MNLMFQRTFKNHKLYTDSHQEIDQSFL